MLSSLRKAISTSILMVAVVGSAYGFDCDRANQLYDDKAYSALLIAYSKLQPSQVDGCLYNIAGLASFKADGDNEQEKKLFGLELLKKSAEVGYLPGTFNLFKYAYRYTDTDLGAILTGLGGLVAEGRAENNRKVSVLSIELGNQIIETCSSSSLPAPCKNRRIKPADKEKFEVLTRETLSNVRYDVDLKSAEVREGKQAIGFALSVLVAGASVAGAAGAVRVPGVTPQPAPPPTGLSAVEMIKLGILK